MEQNSNRDKLLSQFCIGCWDKWVGDKTWNKELNLRIINWMPEYFIPERPYRHFAMCRNQIIQLWHVFQDWIHSTGHSLDLKKIDLEMILEFEKSLSSFGWSHSAIHLIEIVLIKVRQYLHLHRIVWCNSCVASESFSLRPPFLISIQDYRMIRDHIFSEGNDYEISYFELLALDPSVSLELKDLKGRNVLFKKNRSFLVFDHGRKSKKEAHICSLQTSQVLLKLLRSRNILADEFIFGGCQNVRWALEKRIMKFCITTNIPLFAFDSLCGFQRSYSAILPDAVSGCHDLLRDNWFPRRRKKITREHLAAADWIHEYLTQEKECYQVPYVPHSSLVKLAK
jgi:hypothetical protein